MSRIRLYFDEDAMQQALIVALRARYVEVLTASDAAMIHRSDEQHLSYATRPEFVLYSFNIRTTRYSTKSGWWQVGNTPESLLPLSSGIPLAINCVGSCGL